MNTIRKAFKVKRLELAACLFAVNLGCLALAAPASSAESVLEEVVVTAQRRAESIQDVPIAISAFTGDQIKSLGFTNTLDLASMVPGVAVSGSFGGQSAQFTIRGVTQNDYSDIVEGPTAIYLDGGLVIQQNAGGFGLFDTARVEILKGPQGTLFGRNATGGVVNYITQRPTDSLDGYLDASYGEFDSVNLQGALSGPVNDKLRVRGAFYYKSHEDLMNNTFNETRGESELRAAGQIDPAFRETTVPGGGQDHWNEETLAGRVSIEYDFSDRAGLYLMAHGSETKTGENPYQQSPSVQVLDSTGGLIDTRRGGHDTTCLNVNLAGDCVNATGAIDPSSVRPAPGGNFWGYVDPDGDGRTVSKDFAFEQNNSLKMSGVLAEFQWEADSFKFVSLSDYKHFDRSLSDDVDSSPLDTINTSSLSETDSFTQEFRLEGEGEKVRWIAGAYFLYADAENDIGFIISPSSLFALGLGAIDAVNEVSLETKSYSAFGQFDYAVTEDLNFTFGLRATQEEKDYSFNQTHFTNGSSRLVINTEEVVQEVVDYIGDPNPAEPVNLDLDDLFWSGKIGVDYHLTNDLMLYASLNRGIKAGSFNAPLPLFFPGGISLDDLSYDEEVLWAYEIGFKSTIFGGKARLNGAAFYYDYQDYQAFKFVGVSGIVENAEAETIGVELDISATPIEGLDLFLSAAYIDATVKDIEVGAAGPRDVRPTYSSELEVSGFARYTMPLFNGQISLMVDGSYQSEFYDNLSNFGASKQPSRKRFNVRASYTFAEERTTLSAFVENFTNERNVVIGFDVSGFCGCTVDSYDTPRWWGLRLRHDLY